MLITQLFFNFDKSTIVCTGDFPATSEAAEGIADFVVEG